MGGQKLRGEYQVLYTSRGVACQEIPSQLEELSLRNAKVPFMLYEYAEESPMLLSNVGMAHRVQTYYRPTTEKTGTSYDGPPLGPFGTAPTRLVGSQPVPNMLRRQVQLPRGRGIAVMESTLIRAPVFRHSARSTDFLLIRCKSGKREEMHLRRIEGICAVGQTEPLVEVCVPSSRQSAQKEGTSFAI